MSFKIYVNGRPVKQTVDNRDNNITISLPETPTLMAASVSFSINGALRQAVPGVAIDEIGEAVYVSLRQERKAEPTPMVVETPKRRPAAPEPANDQDEPDADADKIDADDTEDEAPRQRRGCSCVSVVATLIIMALIAVAVYYYFWYERPIKITPVEQTTAPVEEPKQPVAKVSEEPIVEEVAPDRPAPAQESAEALELRRKRANEAAGNAYKQLSTLNLTFSDIDGLEAYANDTIVDETVRQKIRETVYLHRKAIAALHSQDLRSYVSNVKDAAEMAHKQFPALSAYLLSRIATRQGGHLQLLPKEDIAEHFNHDKRCQTYR